MNCYSYIDYRKIIDFFTEQLKLSYKKLAQSTGIHTSYFSRVMVGQADFSQEQMYSIGEYLEFDVELLDYFLLLGLYTTSGKSSHRNYIKKQIDSIRHKKLKLKEALKSIETVETKREDYFNYFLNPLTVKVHIFLTLTKYAHNPKLLVKHLNISESQLEEQLSLLKELRFIEIKNGTILMLKDSLNLDESDSISSINHTNWRLEVIKNISKRRPKQSDYHFSVAFSANEEAKQVIKMKFKEYLLEVQKLVVKVNPSEEVFYMTFDLFEES